MSRRCRRYLRRPSGAAGSTGASVTPWPWVLGVRPGGASTDDETGGGSGCSSDVLLSAGFVVRDGWTPPWFALPGRVGRATVGRRLRRVRGRPTHRDPVGPGSRGWPERLLGGGHRAPLGPRCSRRGRAWRPATTATPRRSTPRRPARPRRRTGRTRRRAGCRSSQSAASSRSHDRSSRSQVSSRRGCRRCPGRSARLGRGAAENSVPADSCTGPAGGRGGGRLGGPGTLGGNHRRPVLLRPGGSIPGVDEPTWARRPAGRRGQPTGGHRRGRPGRGTTGGRHPRPESAAPPGRAGRPLTAGWPTWAAAPPAATGGIEAAGQVMLGFGATARAAPLAIAFFGSASTATGRAELLGHQLRDQRDPGRAADQQHRRELLRGQPGRGDRPAQRLHGLLHLRVDRLLELAAVQPHRSAGGGQQHRDRHLGVAAQRFLGLGAVPPDPGDRGQHRRIGVVQARRTPPACPPGRARTPPRRSRSRPAVPGPPAGRATRNLPARPRPRRRRPCARRRRRTCPPPRS